jgi:hypothetical protein
VATITVTVIDSNLQPVVQKFTITVNAVNDAPTLSAISNITIFEDAPAQIFTLSGITPGGGPPESAQTLNFITANVQNPDLFEELPTGEIVRYWPFWFAKV